MKKALLALATAAAFAGAAHAQAPEFATVDADSSGTVSMEEAKAVVTTLTDEQFKVADADASGDLSEAEFQAWASMPAQ